MNLINVIEELVEERGLDRETLNDIIRQGLLAAYERKYPGHPLKAEFDPETGDIAIFIEKEVVATVVNTDTQITIKKAQNIDKKLKEGDKLWLPFESKVGRVEILKARQVIASQIRKVEATAVFNQFKDRQGDVVYGTIHKCDRSGMIIKVDDHLAFLPKSLSMDSDKCVIGFSIRALLKEVLIEPRNDNQLVLDRVSEQFLTRLLELEIPEIFEKLVEIKKIVRSAGYKSKIIVISNDSNIDPVGTCVGVGGSRIKPILKELGVEKIDIIPWSESPENLVRNALKPAMVDRVEVINNQVAKVWLDEDQRALAIGKMGQNISLASRLTGLDIQLMKSENEGLKRDEEEDEERD